MRKLIQGHQHFRQSYVPDNIDRLEELSQGQKPRVLFITCSDSRIDPNLITQADIGELFIIRNAGNIIPPYGAANGGEGAAVEYAIEALGIPANYCLWSLALRRDEGTVAAWQTRRGNAAGVSMAEAF